VKKKMKLLKRIDHVMVESKDPSEAIKLFHGTLGLPLAWPLKDHGFYWSGGIGFGNVNIEYISFKNSEKGLNRLAGVAFEANEKLDKAIQVLKEKGIPHRIGERTENYTSLIFELEGYRTLLFICEYGYPVKEWKEMLRREFSRSGGGIPGVKEVKKVWLNDRNAEVNLPKWSEIASGVFIHGLRFESGPALCLTQDREFIEIKVGSREKAMEHLLRIEGVKTGKDFAFEIQEVDYLFVEE
jgi:hypothetical protein